MVGVFTTPDETLRANNGIDEEEGEEEIEDEEYIYDDDYPRETFSPVVSEAKH